MSSPDAATLFDSALSAYGKSDWAGALRLAREALGVDPQHPGALYLVGALELDAGDAPAALLKLTLASQLAPLHPGIHRSRGDAHSALEQWEQAAAAYRAALRAGAMDAGVLLNLGLALHELEDWEGAIASFNEAIRLNPRDAGLYNNLAVTLNRKHDYGAAAEAYERARGLDPANVGVLANLATLYEQMNELDKAEGVIAQGLALAPHHDVLQLVAARCERRRGELEKAVARILPVLERPETGASARRGLHFELGRSYDAMGEIEPAYRHFSAGNRIATELWPDMTEGARLYLQELDAMLAGLDAESLQAMAAPRASGSTRSPVFLVSFPRSGTTLMDTILGAHPGVAVMEEEPPLHRVHQAVLASRGDDPRAVLALTEGELERLRALYWSETAKYLGERAGTALVVDKNPFYSTRAALIHRLFPGARFIFALRHPCAVVLSCFMQPFGRNPALANFTDLLTGAEAYRRVMNLWLRFRSSLPLNVHELRYESLVMDKEGPLKETLAFLGLEWDASLSDHVAHARKRGRIYTPSYHQVSRPIYTDAVNRWRNYEGYFGEALATLRPFIREFGYEP